jgi:hypothetical protein
MRRYGGPVGSVRAINTVLSSLKTVLGGTYDAFAFV